MSCAVSPSRLIEKKKEERAEALLLDAFALFSDHELECLSRMVPNWATAAQLRAALGVSDSSAEAGLMLRRLPGLCGVQNLARGGTLFLFAHAGKDAFDNPEIEQSSLKHVFEEYAKRLAAAGGQSWLVEDGVWTQITNKIGSVLSWDGAQGALAGILEAGAKASDNPLIRWGIGVIAGAVAPSGQPGQPGPSKSLPAATSQPKQLPSGSVARSPVSAGDPIIVDAND